HRRACTGGRGQRREKRQGVEQPCPFVAGKPLEQRGRQRLARHPRHEAAPGPAPERAGGERLPPPGPPALEPAPAPPPPRVLRRPGPDRWCAAGRTGWRRGAGRGTLGASFVWADKGGDPFHGPVVKVREGVSRFPSASVTRDTSEPLVVRAHAELMIP